MSVERRTDDETRSRIDQLIEETHDAHRAGQRRVTLIMLAQVLLLGCLCIAVGYFHGEAAQSAHQAHELAVAIQTSRVENALRTCERDNARNKASRAFFESLLAPRVKHASPALKRRLDRSRRDTEALLDRIVPTHHDRQGRDTCPVFAAQQTAIPLAR
jgi:hypothetical protein